jgi:hypothetical protein
VTPASQVRIYLVLGFVACASACGRFDFERHEIDASLPAMGPDADGPPLADAAIDVPPADGPCVFGAWTERADDPPFAQVNTAAIEWSPELSDDGLRVIFASDRPSVNGDAVEHLYTAQRTSRTEPFGPATFLAVNSDTGHDNEPSSNASELYFISNRGTDATDCIYVAPRTDTPEMWGTPRRLDALCAGNPQLGGLYISRDGQHLYYDNEGQVVMAQRGATEFDTPGTPVLGVLSEMRFCTLTADELTIYCETSVATDQPTQLWQASRTTGTEQFTNAGQIPDLDTTGRFVGDPAITSDGKLLIYASGPSLSSGQDLRLAERTCQ